MDTLYFNGRIYIEKGVFAEAMLIIGDRIKETGTSEKLLGLSRGKRVDLKGRTVIPGFNDSHMHLSWVGELKSMLNLKGARSIEEVIGRGRQFLKDHPQTRVLTGKGWNEMEFSQGEKRLLTNRDLDKISRDIPVILDRVCLHIASANSRALEFLYPKEGENEERESKSPPDGIFREEEISRLHAFIPRRTLKDMKHHLLVGMEHALKLGITSLQSTDIMMSRDVDLVFSALSELVREGQMKLRYRHQFNFREIEDFKKWLDGESHNELYDEIHYSRGALKLFKDGSLGGRTALLKKDYQDMPGERGVDTLEEEKLLGFMRLAEDNGIQVVIHAIGDAAVEAVISAIEETMAEGNPLRHGIVHCQITSKDQLKKIASLKIPVFGQPVFLLSDIPMATERVGGTLAETSYAFHTLVKLGASLSLSSDAPVEDCDPFLNLYAAVNRMRLDGLPKGGFYPSERLSLEDALDAYTLGSAYNEGSEKIKGRLKPGFLADFLILDRDIFTLPSQELPEIRVLETYVGGERAFRRQE